jgi:hypothetical protein
VIGACEVTPTILWKPSINEFVAAELWDAITDAQVSDWEKLWKPGAQELRGQVRELDLDPDSKVETSYWNWGEKVEAIEGLLSSACFSVVAEGITQGLMILDYLQSCQLPEQKGLPLVYISYIEVAPWNQKPIASIVPQFTGVGSLLMRAAIEASRANEFSGRVGLHSLRRSENWYRHKCGMTALGQQKQGLRYFEITPEQADAFTAPGRNT